jgi:tetratricopeptide (TPR) repeat protein
LNLSRSCRFLMLLAGAALFGCATTTPVRTHFNKGVRLYDEKNYAGAAREYRLAIEEEPLDYRSHFNLAMSLEELGRRDLAREEYAWILSFRPCDLRASVNLAAIEIEDGERDAGYARLQGMVDRYPTLAMPRVALATHYLKDGRLDEAETLVREGLKRDDSDIEANFLLGEILVRKADGLDAGSEQRACLIKEARKAFETALANAPNDVPSLLALGRLARSEGKTDRARDYYRRVVLQKRDSLDAHMALADLYQETGELEDAVYQLWQVRKIDPKRDEEISVTLARLYAELERQARSTSSSRPSADQP